MTTERKTPVQDLKARYSRSRSVIYTWLKALGIDTERIGKRAYIDTVLLSRLDALHAYLVNGGSIQEFLHRPPEEED